MSPRASVVRGISVYDRPPLLSVNKRLDEWVTESWLDTRKVQFPRPAGSGGTGACTPKKTTTVVPAPPSDDRRFSESTAALPPAPPPAPVPAPAPAPEKVDVCDRARAASPELVNGGAVLDAALHKKMNRKRKATTAESEASLVRFQPGAAFRRSCDNCSFIVSFRTRWTEPRSPSGRGSPGA